MDNKEFNEIQNKKVRYNIGDNIIYNGLTGKILFGPYEKGFFNFYEIEDENGQIYSVNGKHLSKNKKL